MIQLRCTVRGCLEPLQPTENSLRCSKGHNFDLAKEGYWNLTQPQDKKSSNPGDTDAAVLARHRWLENGYAAGLIEALQTWTDISDDGPVLDLGCGEGTFGSALFANRLNQFCGIDLSRKAIRLAARRTPDATWVLANADRTLPLADDCVVTVMSLFGRRPVAEIGRVLQQGGRCVVAIPGEDDLIELREQVQQAGIRRSRSAAVVEEMKSANLELVEQKRWSQQFELGAADIADALAMTYRAVRHAEQARLEGVESKTVTLSADLLLFERSNSRGPV